MYEYFEASYGFIIVMERLNNSKDLFDYITEKRWLSEDVTRDIFQQLINTLSACQAVGVLHRDVKDENILIDVVTQQIRLIDFGSGAFLRNEEYTEFDGEWRSLHYCNCAARRDAGALTLSDNWDNRSPAGVAYSMKRGRDARAVVTDFSH